MVVIIYTSTGYTYTHGLDTSTFTVDYRHAGARLALFWPAARFRQP